MARPPLALALLLTLSLLLGDTGAAADAATPVQRFTQAEPGRVPTSQRVGTDARIARYFQLLNARVVELHAQGQYDDAERMALHVAALAEHELGSDHPHTLDSVTNLATVYVELENFDEAERLLLRTLPVQEAIFGENDPEALLPALNSLASLYRLQGSLSKAEPWYLRALRICEEVLGDNHLATLAALNNLAGLYRAQGRRREAEPLYRRGLRTSEAMLGERDPRSLTLANNLAGLYQDLERYDEAESLFETTLRRTKAVFGEDHPHTLGSLNNLALLYFARGRFDEAEPLLRTVLQKTRDSLGESHSAVLKTANSLASLYRHTDRYVEAEALFQATLASSGTALGDSHPHTMTVMRNLTGLYFATGEPDRILPLLRRLEGAAFAYTDDELPTTSGEAQKRRLLARQRIMQDLALNLAMRYPTAQHLQFAATVVFRWSQVQGEQQAFLQRLSRRTDDPEVRALATDIRDARSALSGLANATDPDPGELRAALARLADLEIRISQRSRLYRRHLAIRDLAIDDVRGALPGNAALLVLATYRPIAGTEDERPPPLRYAVIFLSADGSHPLELHDAGPVQEFRARGLALKRGREFQAAWLYSRLVGQWDDYVRHLDSVYVVPNGWLHHMNFERMILPDGRYWIERQPVHRLQAARDLLRDFPAAAKTGGLLAFGGIDYGTPPGGGGNEEPASDVRRNLSSQLIGGFDPLPASGKELKQLAGLFWTTEEGDGEEIKRAWRDRNAAEHKLKQLAQPPQVLHLATHAFYLEDQLDVGRPMVLSGLALANANRGIAGEADETGQDGILYALEAQDLQLEGTQLVTLSACETGQGVVDYAEGIYGLVRAFRVAGARHVLMTLEKVNDEAAYHFMRRFYLIWLASGRLEHPYKALRETKLTYIQSQADPEYSPRLWAPFVLVEVP